MPTLLDDALDQNLAVPADTSMAAERLRTSMAAARVAFTWFGTRKTLSPQQKEQAADAFGAEGAFLSAGKKLLDTSHEAFKAVTAVRGKIAAYWRGISLPYPEPGIRLVRQDAIGPLDAQLTEYKTELDRAVIQLDHHIRRTRRCGPRPAWHAIQSRRLSGHARRRIRGELGFSVSRATGLSAAAQSPTLSARMRAGPQSV